MKKLFYLLILVVLMNIGMVLTASSQEQVAQTVYVYDGDLNGSLLSDVQVTGEDAVGTSFDEITDSNGAVVIHGAPGTWRFAFMKEGYDTLDLNYDVAETGEGAVYLQKASQPQGQVSQTVYVFEGEFNGTLLPDVHIIGKDSAGNSFEGVTDSNGTAVIYGEGGLWQFMFMKEGYEPLNLDYDVSKTGEGAVYLQRATQSQDQAEAPQEDQQQSFQPVPMQAIANQSIGIQSTAMQTADFTP